MVDVTGSSVFYTNFVLQTMRGDTFTPESNVLKMGLLLNSYSPSKAHVNLSEVAADEVAGNGYSRQTLTNVLIAQDGDFIKMTFDPPSFTATGGNLAPQYWFLFDDSLALDPLIAYGFIDVNTQASILLVDTHSLSVVVNDLGFYRVAA